MSEVQNRIIGIVGRKGTGKSSRVHELLRHCPRFMVFDVIASQMKYSCSPSPATRSATSRPHLSASAVRSRGSVWLNRIHTSVKAVSVFGTSAARWAVQAMSTC
jgi:hypothetical protein